MTGTSNGGSKSSLAPCSWCGFMMRGGNLCGDCLEYGPPLGWRWEYDEKTGKHKRVAVLV